MNIRLLRGRLLIAKDPDITMQRGFHVPDVSVIRACSGLVLMHEPVMLEDMTDRKIFYAKFSETAFPVGNKNLFTITEDCVMAVFEEK
jgi:hypothetical protein